MTRIVPTSVLCAIMCACSQNGNRNATNEALKTGDAKYEFQWSHQKERFIEQKARNGDQQAARDLYAHYLMVGEQKGANYWENVLVEQRYPPAMIHKSETLYNQALPLEDRDPNKRKLLGEALGIVSEALKLPRPANLRVFVNGRYETVPNRGAEDLRDAIEHALKRTSALAQNTPGH